MAQPDVIIAGAARTPIAAFQGSFAEVAAPKLGAIAIRAALERAGVPGEAVDEVLMGCVLQAGLGQAPARQAAIFAGLPHQVGATTIHKVCGSGMKAVMLARQMILAGDAEIVVAGGMENMSRAPYLLERARGGYRIGHGELVDGMIRDGLWDPYRDFHMGSAAEICAREFKVSRAEQDAFAAESYRRAQRAQAEGLFAREIVPVEVPARKGPPLVVSVDEGPARGDMAKLAALKPAFEKDGTITAGNASSLNDGAAALVVMSRPRAEALGVRPRARILAQGAAALAPEWFTTAPAGAMRQAVERAGLGFGEVDWFEVNEAFAVVALAVASKLGIDLEKVNPRGGAVALGHPIGCSGARILVTLLHTLEDTKKRYGCAGICLGGGEAVALVIERLEG
jgi:acetyl-CoA C-acetyltransferase